MNNATGANNAAAGTGKTARKPAQKLFCGVKEIYRPPLSVFAKENDFEWERVYHKGTKKPENVSGKEAPEFCGIVSINWFRTEAEADRYYAERRRETACENRDEFDEYYDPEYDEEYDRDRHYRGLQIDTDIKRDRENGRGRRSDDRAKARARITRRGYQYQRQRKEKCHGKRKPLRRRTAGITAAERRGHGETSRRASPRRSARKMKAPS